MIDSYSLLIAGVALAAGAALGWVLASLGAGRRQAEAAAEWAARQATADARLQAEAARAAALTHQLAERERGLTELRGEAAALRETAARLQAEVAAAADRQALVTKTEESLRESFRALAAEALHQNSQAILAQAKSALETSRAEATGDLERRQQAIDGLVKPIADTLRTVDQRLTDVERDRIATTATLVEQLRQLGSGLTSLQGETGRLVKALRQPHVRGHWGEVQLRQVVELAGMSEHTDFIEQPSITTEDGRLQPDLIVRLPGGKRVIVDSKTPLMAYLDALEADEAERPRRMAEHARQVRDHVSKLAGKAYWSQFDDSPEFVVMFLPGESFFSAALAEDPRLIEHGIANRVVLASPTTLIALLKAVSYGWRQERLAENAQQISDLGRQLYERLLILATHFDDIRRGLDKAVEAYNRSVASLESRVLVAARRFKDLGTGVVQDIDETQIVERTTREVQAPELKGLLDD